MTTCVISKPILNFKRSYVKNQYYTDIQLLCSGNAAEGAMEIIIVIAAVLMLNNK